ncbi:MAG TPA: DUF4136 domain-containing protein [Candidatus Krumholzibacteria bacterium]|nr:DUF4136 domain-containing protein [Candidatus Krumholzibacteria bacterium]
MRIRAMAAAAASLLFLGCSQYDIKSDYDLDSNFAAFRTYAWMTPATTSEGATSANTAIQRNTLLDKRIRSAVDAAMASKGFTVNDENPDVLVVYHTGMQNKVDVTDWGYSYAGSYWGWAGRDIDVYNYTEGTLIVDLVNSQTKQLAWRGSATGVVEPGRSPEEVQERINDVVTKIFDNYPPKAR